MSLNWRQFELGVLRPTLTELVGVMPAPEVAVKLVGETLWHESDRLCALGQYPLYQGLPTKTDPFGPGLGIASIEEPTWDWMASKPVFSKLFYKRMNYQALVYDLKANVVACRLRYFLDPMPLPLGDANRPDGIEARATYWWKVYNRGQVDRRPDYIRNAKVIPWA